MEIWKDVPGYEGHYQVSCRGRIKSIKKKPLVMRQFQHYKGYLYLYLYKEGSRQKFFCHRLVGIVFLENPEEKPIINHIDRDRQNNQLENLEWCTDQENQDHRWAAINNDEPF